MNKQKFVSALFAFTAFYGVAEPVEAHDSADLISLEHRWDQAELDGDQTFFEQLLLPDYRTVTFDGRAFGKQDLVSSVTRGTRESRAAQAAAWRSAHPQRMTVIMQKDMAIVQHLIDGGPQDGRVISADIFSFQRGAWRAAYSVHSDAAH